MRSFAKIKPSRNGEITMAFTDTGKSCPIRLFVANMSFNAIRGNKNYPKNIRIYKVNSGCKIYLLTERSVKVRCLQSDVGYTKTRQLNPLRSYECTLIL